jgi:hypothetical protein
MAQNSLQGKFLKRCFFFFFLRKAHFVEETSRLLTAICSVVSPGGWGVEWSEEKVLKAIGMNVQIL